MFGVGERDPEGMKAGAVQRSSAFVIDFRSGVSDFWKGLLWLGLVQLFCSGLGSVFPDLGAWVTSDPHVFVVSGTVILITFSDSKCDLCGIRNRHTNRLLGFQG